MQAFEGDHRIIRRDIQKILRSIVAGLCALAHLPRMWLYTNQLNPFYCREVSGLQICVLDQTIYFSNSLLRYRRGQSDTFRPHLQVPGPSCTTLPTVPSPTRATSRIESPSIDITLINFSEASWSNSSLKTVEHFQHHSPSFIHSSKLTMTQPKVMFHCHRIWMV